MPSKFVWAGIAAFAVFIYRRARSCRVDLHLLRANFGEAVTSPDATGAVLALLPNASGVELYVRCWGVDRLSVPRGVVVLLHGGKLHSKYFEHFAKHLVKHQYVAYAFDLQAHGLSGSSAGARGDISSFGDLVHDMSLVLNFARGNHRGAPFFVYGESMGSSIALLWELEHGAKQIVDGFVLVGAMTAVKKEMKPTGLVLMMWWLLERVCPTARVYGRKIEGGMDRVVADAGVVAAVEKDPLVVCKSPSVRFMFQELESVSKIDAGLGQVTSPFIALHGLDDCKCDWGNSQRLFEEAASEDKTIKLYEGMRHHLLQELPENQEQVYSDIVQWLNSHTPELPQKSDKTSAEFNLPEYSFPGKH